MPELTTLVRRARGNSGGDPLDIRGLRMDFPDLPGAPAIGGMELSVGRGDHGADEGVVSGKSLTALTVRGLLPQVAEVIGARCRWMVRTCWV
jgi:peptide/nickel transport system ATP-binding protein